MMQLGGGEHTPATPLTSHSPTPPKKKKTKPKTNKKQTCIQKNKWKKNPLTAFVGRYG